MPAHPRMFRFGVVAGGLSPGADWAAVAKGAESLGYSILLMPDHLNGQLAPIPALAAAAAATATLRVGTLVLANDLRHPLLVARDAATIDMLSGGRFELGLGAGWLRDDYDRLGAAFDPARTRVRRLAEAVTVVRGVLAEPGFWFRGTHYSVAGGDDAVLPVQRPLPILVGGGGREVLSVAATLADIVSVNPDLRGGELPPLHGGGSAGDLDRQIAWVKAAAGPRYPELEINLMLRMAAVGKGQDGRAGGAGPYDARRGPPSPYVVTGSAGQVGDLLEERRARWDISYICVPAADMVAFGPVAGRLTGR